ncbi:universal stress protein [Pseudomonas stutzeri]|nr:universal stress protein [Stutzerimonas stutzeri]
MPLKQLLVIIDPTQTPQPALARAAWIARRSGAALELLICEFNSTLDSGLLFDAPALDKARASLLAQRREWLEQLAAPLRQEGLTVGCEVRWGKPLHKMIIVRAEELKPDLVLKTAHSHGLIRRLLLSNTCWQLLRYCPAPLWLVKPEGEWRGQRLAAALDPTHSADKPAALDHQLIAVARELSQTLGLEDHYLHSYAPLPRTLVFDAELVADYEYYVERTGERHREAFEQLLEGHAIDKPRSHLLQGFAEETLPRFVEENAVDLLVMGAIARGHLDTALIGHTAERVLENVDCDLLVVKPQGAPAP